MPESIAIIGAGLLGRLCALRAERAGASVTLFDQDRGGGEFSCALAGAGMLAPVCELEHADEATARLGLDSAERWQALIQNHGLDLELQQQGSLVIAHPGDEEELGRLKRKVTQTPWASGLWQTLDAQRISALEPGLADRFSQGLFFPREGHVSNDGFLDATTRALHSRPAINWLTGIEVTQILPGIVQTRSRRVAFDQVIDTRGLGARSAWSGMRGVRGELVHLDAPEVSLNRPVRLMHPRYPIYIVPRAGSRFVIGATQIESDDAGPATVRSALELLSAAYTVHPGFAEARIVGFRTACRPALPHNQPRIRHRPGLVEANGLFRHGFLLGPVISEAAVALALGVPCPNGISPFLVPT